MENTSIDVLPKQNTGSEIPFASVKLPSKGKLYPKGHPLHNQETVDIREMVTADEDILFSEALVKKGTVLNELIRSCCLNKLLDPSTLLLGDKASMLLAIRISAFSADYRVMIRCNGCGADFENSFDLSKINLKFLEKEPVQPFTNLFEYNLPNGTPVHFSLMTDADDLELSAIEANTKKLGPKAKQQRMTNSLRILIKKLGTETDGGLIKKKLESLPIKQSRALRKYIREVTPDTIMKQSVVCPICDEEEVKVVPMGLSFFWPDLDE